MNEIVIVDIETKEIITRSLDGPANNFSYSPNGDKLVAVTEYSKLSLFNSETIETIAESNIYWG